MYEPVTRIESGRSFHGLEYVRIFKQLTKAAIGAHIRRVAFASISLNLIKARAAVFTREKLALVLVWNTNHTKNSYTQIEQLER